MADNEASFEFDVALSFAGEDRSYVEEIAAKLSALGINVFYDRFAVVDSWGADLYELFDDVFRKRARFAIVFVSRHYVSKPWTRHERQSAQARSLLENGPYLLPVRLDDTEVPGLHHTVGYVDARETTVDELVELIARKLQVTTHDETPSARTTVPRSDAALRVLLATRPPFWEYYLFGGVLVLGKARLEPKWHDHQLGYIVATGEHLLDDDVPAFLSRAMNDLTAITGNLDRLLGPMLNESAFGAPGDEGDAAQIKHVGTRIIAMYESLLDWSMHIRSVRRAETFEALFRLSAEFADLPLRQFRDFIDGVERQFNAFPEMLQATATRPLELTIELTLSADPQLLKAHSREVKRLRRHLR